MHEFHLDTIGTHLRICIDTSSPIGEDFSLIQKRLRVFEQTFSRFIPDNWLADLNMSRHGILDIDGEIMLGTMLHLARKSDGYFDPTIGKRLRELGYANSAVPQYQGVVTTLENVSNDYRDIDLTGNHVTLKGDIELEF